MDTPWRVLVELGAATLGPLAGFLHIPSPDNPVSGAVRTWVLDGGSGGVRNFWLMVFMELSDPQKKTMKQ